MSKYNMLSGKVDSILKNGDKIDELTSKQDELKAICSDGISSIKNDLKATFETILSESGSNIQNSEKILKLVDSIDKKLDKGLSLLESIEDTYEDTNIDVSVTKETLNTICEIVTRISKTLNVDFSIPMDELFGAKEEIKPDETVPQQNEGGPGAPEVKPKPAESEIPQRYVTATELATEIYSKDAKMKKLVRSKGENGIITKLVSFGVGDYRYTKGTNWKVWKSNKTSEKIDWIVSNGADGNISLIYPMCDKHIRLMYTTPKKFQNYIRDVISEAPIANQTNPQVKKIQTDKKTIYSPFELVKMYNESNTFPVVMKSQGNDSLSMRLCNAGIGHYRQSPTDHKPRFTYNENGIERNIPWLIKREHSFYLLYPDCHEPLVMLYTDPEKFKQYLEQFKGGLTE